MNPTVRQIRAFVVVAQTGSFTRAADLLGLAQPTLTVQIRRMEDALRLKLFDRTARSVTLTRSGEQLLPVFQRIVREFDGAVVDAQDIALGRHGVIRVATIPTAAAWLADAISSFRASHPAIGFVVKDVVGSRALELVRSGEVDIGVSAGPLDESAFTTFAGRTDTLCLVYPAGHSASELAEVSLDTICRWPLILMEPGTTVRGVIDRALAAEGIAVVPSCEVTYMTTAVALVRAGLGLAVLPDSAPELYLHDDLRFRPIDNRNLQRRVVAFRSSTRTPQKLSERFCHHLASMV